MIWAIKQTPRRTPGQEINELSGLKKTGQAKEHKAVERAHNPSKQAAIGEQIFFIELRQKLYLKAQKCQVGQEIPMFQTVDQ